METFLIVASIVAGIGIIAVTVWFAEKSKKPKINKESKLPKKHKKKSDQIF